LPEGLKKSIKKGEKMIRRIWHGWTTPEKADTYEMLLKEEVITGIQDRHIPGFEDIQVLRRDAGDEVEFVTIMTFDSIEAVVAFAGEDYQAAYVPQAAREVLSHFDSRAQHFELRAEMSGVR
jgi:antibiotic biosynthesis monooxygenase (ABM) superfamily enzyme